MPFTFKNYGTFTGPNSLTGDYDYDVVSEETFWHTDLPTDTSFKLTDIAVVFFRDPSDYMGFYANGVNTNLVTLAKSTGPIPVFVGNIKNSLFSGNVFVNKNVTANGNVIANGVVKCNSVVRIAGVGNAAAYMKATRKIASSKKSFDIPHPTKKDHRLRYVCLEGPSAEVYVRGKLENNNIIDLPDYWEGLIDPETIGVNLTPFGTHQELFVEKIEWGKRVVIRNNLSSSISCFYTITAERKDTDKNIPEYKGLTPEDYPGDNNSYNVNGL